MTPPILVIEARSPAEAYPKLLHAVLNGERSYPRGKTCIKVPTPVFVQYENPYRPFVLPVCAESRGYNLPFALAETLSIFGAYSQVSFQKMFNKNVTQFSDNGVDFNGHYGIRMAYSVNKVLNLLLKDPDTRQAVIPIYHPMDSMENYNSRDIPCNTQVVLKMRNGKLNMHVARRSNDIFWGYPYNLCQFMHLHALWSIMLGVPAGTFSEFISDLHVYDGGFYELADVSKFLELGGGAGSPWSVYEGDDLQGMNEEPTLKVFPRSPMVDWRTGVMPAYQSACIAIDQLSHRRPEDYVLQALNIFNDDVVNPYWGWMVGIPVLFSVLPRGKAMWAAPDEEKDRFIAVGRCLYRRLGDMPPVLRAVLRDYLAAYPKLGSWFPDMSSLFQDGKHPGSSL